MEELRNKDITNFLFDKENVECLEHVLNRESKFFTKLDSYEMILYYGEKVKKKDLRPLFLEVKNHVDDFLDTKDFKEPRCNYFSILKPSHQSVMVWLLYGYSIFSLSPGLLVLGMMFHYLATKGNSYSHITKSLTLAKEDKKLLTPILAHEYTHFVQHRNKADLYGLIEGHARGVERYIARLYREKKDDKAYLYHTLAHTVGELKNAYKWICKKTQKTPNKNLLNVKAPNNSAGLLGLIGLKPTHYAIGTAAMSIVEEQHGLDVYKRYVHGDHSFFKK